MINKLLGITDRASEHAHLIDNMLEFCHWFMLVLFVGWSAFFLYTLFRFHKSRHPKASYYGVKSKAASHVEFMVVLVEAVILLGFGLPLWGKRVYEMPKEGGMKIKVVGQQFLWSFHYPGPDGIFGEQQLSLISASNQLGVDFDHPAGKDDIVLTNEFHVPINEPVTLEISAKDVIHNVSLHHMRIEQDAIPGTKVPIAFRPTKAGQYELICGQLCGAGHASMKAVLYVDTPDDYKAWETEIAQMQARK